MKEEIDGGNFTSKKEEMSEKQSEKLSEKAGGQFILGEPSVITTDDMFILLGEQMTRAKNWSKIALAWQNNFKALQERSLQVNAQFIVTNKQNQDLKDSNSKYVGSNQLLEKRVTELNLSLKDMTSKFSLSDKLYFGLSEKYKDLENKNIDTEKFVTSLRSANKALEEKIVFLNDSLEIAELQIKSLEKENKDLKDGKEKSDKEKASLAVKIVKLEKQKQVAFGSKVKAKKPTK